MGCFPDIQVRPSGRAEHSGGVCLGTLKAMGMEVAIRGVGVAEGSSGDQARWPCAERCGDRRDQQGGRAGPARWWEESRAGVGFWEPSQEGVPGGDSGCHEKTEEPETHIAED